MKLFILEYIENFLRNAQYEYDLHTQSWCAHVKELPGVYAQDDSVEEVRSQLAEIIEDYIFVSLQKGHPLSMFKESRDRTAEERAYV